MYDVTKNKQVITVLDTSAKMAPRIGNKLHIIQEKEVVIQTRERIMRPIINFHQLLKTSLKVQQEKVLKLLYG